MKLAALPILSGVVLLGDLAGVFTGALDHPAIEYSNRPDRRSIIEILRETKKDLPRYFL